MKSLEERIAARKERRKAEIAEMSPEARPDAIEDQAQRAAEAAKQKGKPVTKSGKDEKPATDPHAGNGGGGKSPFGG